MNKKFLPFLFLAIVLTVSIFACKKADEDTPPADPDSTYFPLQKGKFVIYNVDSTIWNDQLCIKLEKHFQMMYTIADTFTDAQGRPSYRIETRVRDLERDPWKMQEVIYVTKTNTNFEWVQDERRFIKMVFPVADGATWKGNSYIPAGDKDLWFYQNWDYTYSNVGGSYNAGEVIFDNTVTVNQVDRKENDPETIPMDRASRTFGKEVYAQNIGMVYREYAHWTYDPTSAGNSNPFNTDRCRQGSGVIMRAIDHN